MAENSPVRSLAGEPIAGLDNEKETALYSHLVKKAHGLNIDISGSSIHSSILHQLLQSIIELERHRDDLSGQLQSNPFAPTPRRLKSSHQTAINATTRFTFDLEFYNDSSQSIFYTELHNIRLKLNYEVDVLEDLVAEKEALHRQRPYVEQDSESAHERGFDYNDEEYETNGDDQPANSNYSDFEYDQGSRPVAGRSPPKMIAAPSRRIIRSRYVEVYDDGESDEAESDHSEDNPQWILLHTAFEEYDEYDDPPNDILYVRIHGSSVSTPRPRSFRLNDFLRRNKSVAFVVERQYDFDSRRGESTQYDEKMFLRQTIQILSDSLEEFFEAFKPPEAPRRRSWDVGLVLFHCREEIRHLAESNDDPTSVLVRQLLDATQSDYEEATTLFGQGLVTRSHLNKLFFTNTVLVSSSDPVETLICDTKALDFKPGRGVVMFEASRWLYDGQFYRSSEAISVKAPRWPSEIRGLGIYPLAFATPEIQELIKKRSETYWMCRYRSFVAYSAPGQTQRTQGPSNYRFMIDYETYRELHPDADEFTDLSIESAIPMTEEEMKSDRPPGGGLELLFPAKISGFSIQDKKWKTLLVDYIKPVSWNKTAFDRLVLKPVAKELIRAVVDVHDTKEKSADLMQGKGNGSLILLHGPPGTGKTLTAESVAELVQRPLYRVTCGDVGTDPESVENYLEAVLYIGKIWGCVVLLDEADVFLEERTLTDLHRNALVSVFLRVLEYYDGILILTSNRVGTFDEAFKSRIKLALHYTALEKADRRKVWRNFFKTLKETDPERVDFEDLEDHLDDLANIKLNGRDIRNAIAVSRELARFRKDEKMNFEHIRHVIGIGEEFERYLDKTHKYKTDDWLRENGIRA